MSSQAVGRRALPILLSLTTGCLPLFEETTEYTIEQTGTVPAPRGSRQASPRIGAWKVALEGSYSGAVELPSGDSRYQGEFGDVVTAHALSGRSAVGLGDIAELGYAVEYADSRLGVQLALGANTWLSAQLYGHLGRGAERYPASGALSVRYDLAPTRPRE